MIDKFKKSLSQASDALKDQMGNLGDSAKEKTFSMFEQYAEIFPKLQEYGMEMKTFGISVSISPAMEVVLKGKSKDFEVDRVDELIKTHKGETIITSVFRTMKTSIEIYEKSGGPQFEHIYLKIAVKISPEVKVVLGEPMIL